MNKIETPVLLLTGYLGSGKTTLLNRILQNKKGIKFAVIVNDIGEVNIDASLIEKGGIVNEQDDSLVALQNGCICCTLKMDLVKQLQDIIALHRFDYIVIEASGICEPAPIAQTICSIPQMAPEVTAEGYPRLDSIVTVVDALRLKDEFIQQIEFCNIVLLNKAADVEPHELGRIREIIRTLQPKAEIIDCNYGDVDLDKIINTHMFDFNEVATSAAWIAEIEGHHDDEDDDDDDDHNHNENEDHDEHEHHHHHDHDDDDEHEEHGHHHHHHHHHDHEGGEVEEYGIGTYVYYRRPAFDLGRFDEFVARKWPKNVIRAKGICYFDDEKQTCYVFEQAGKQVSLRNAGQWYATMPKDQLAQFLHQNPGVMRDWDVKYGDRMQKLVFIGQHLDRKEIERLLDECLAEE